MSVHEQFADDLALYALGELQGEERRALENHVRDCASCRRELELLRGDMALVGLSVPVSDPPQRARRRLVNAIARESKVPSQVRQRRAWRVLIPYFVATALALALVIVWRQNSQLRSLLTALERRRAQQQVQLDEARQTLATFTSPEAMHVTLVALKTPPQPQGKAFYLRSTGRLVFIANNLGPLPAQRAYELWLIPVRGTPLPAGVFKPDARGSATIVNPALPAGVEAKAFAITVEPLEGSPAPTSQPIMVGAGE